MTDPRGEYAERLRQCEAAYAAHDMRHLRLGPAKLGAAAIGLVLLWFVLAQHSVDAYWLVIPILGYGLLAVAHELVLRKRRAAQTAGDLYRRGIARIEHRWAGSGASGEQFRDAEHVYAEDLDLFGNGCLFQLLSTARLPMGESRLAAWLKNPSTREEALERQGLIAELRGKLDLHRELAIAGEDLRPRMVPETLTEWAEAAAALPNVIWRLVAAGLAVAAAAAIVFYFENVRTWPVLVGVLAVEGALWGWLRQRMKEAIAKLDCNAEGLELFARVVEMFERETFASERLKAIAAELRGTDPATAGTASESLRRLARAVYWVDNRENLMAKIAELPFLYTLQVAFAAEAWKRRFGSRMQVWIDIAGEMEALVSLATYSFEHPADVFPEFMDAAGGLLAEGEDLGHPLIAAEKCVRNSVRLDSATRLLLVSGSNMSGKSTLLRTVGINTVLAMAGAPIRGARMRLTPLAVGTRIRSGDSLQEGRSNFYTEILHIRRVVELARRGATLFLFDELLEGTNSHDRRIGAEKLLAALLGSGAIGMVTTHDLALTEIGAAIGDVLRNVHFEDFVEEGKMRFDYRLRDGVVTKSNAIELMRVVGLDV